MPFVTRTVIIYIDDELVEVDIEIYEPVKQNICRLCETVELFGDNEIICPECWLTVEDVDPKVELVEDDVISYRSFTPFRIENAQLQQLPSLISTHEVGGLNEKRCKEMSQKRNQSDVSDVSHVSEVSDVSETNEE